MVAPPPSLGDLSYSLKLGFIARMLRRGLGAGQVDALAPDAVAVAARHAHARARLVALPAAGAVRLLLADREQPVCGALSPDRAARSGAGCAFSRLRFICPQATGACAAAARSAWGSCCCWDAGATSIRRTTILTGGWHRRVWPRRRPALRCRCSARVPSSKQCRYGARITGCRDFSTHLAVYPVRGKPYLLPFESSPHGRAFSGRAFGQRARTLGAVCALRFRAKRPGMASWLAARQWLFTGWRTRNLGSLGMSRP